MPWKALAVPRYNKRRKKLTPELRKRLNDVQSRILQDPHVGDRQRGALKNVWVEKFPAQNDHYLVADEIDDKNDAIIFLDVGQHENFYRDLERYLKTAQ